MAAKKQYNRNQFCLECQRLRMENDLLRQENAVLCHRIEQLNRLAAQNSVTEQSGQQTVLTLESSQLDKSVQSSGTTHTVFPAQLTEIVTLIPDYDVNPFEITNASRLNEKIDLFRSLFKGREDVYAKRYESTKSGRAGYTPVCRIDWKPGLCPKPDTKCQDCSNRDFLPIDDNVIELHLRGKLVMGVYPIMLDKSCWFLVIDFDKGDWQGDILAVRQFCEERKIPIAVERSRSGKGAHVWFFFQQPIPATKARNFGSVLITSVMHQRHEISFSSYDRMIPTQDILSRDGLGNLIALPLQGSTAAAGNSCFIDQEFKPYPDQWYYLSKIRRLQEFEIDQFISNLTETSELGELNFTEEPETEKPWHRKRETVLSPSDFPSALTITLANGIFVPKKNLTQRAMNKIQRLAAFSNPEFYKKQALRFSTWDTPRIITCHQEHDAYFQLPRGCLEPLIALLNNAQVKRTINDERQTGQPIRVSFKGTLWPQQQNAVDAMIERQMGVLCGTTAFGKTITAIALIAHYCVNTLILVDTVPLMQQWQSKLNQFLDVAEQLPDEERKRGRKRIRSIIGTLGGSRHDLHQVIDIAVFNSALEKDETGMYVAKDFLKDYGLVIVDECHHVAAATFEKVMSHVNARYAFGLSATPVRQDGKHPIVFMQCGPIVYRDDAKKQAEDRPFSHMLLPRFTNYQLPIEWNATNVQIQAVLTDLILSGSRNRQIVQDIIEAVRNGRNVIVLTDRKEHVECLVQSVKPTIPDVIALTGTGTAKQKKDKLELISKFPDDQPILIIATGKYVGEGFDVPRLDTLFLVMPFSWKGTLAQYAGRLHRIHSGKSSVQIYDYVDIHVPVLERMYGRRLKGYRDIGYQSGEPGLTPARIDLIFDQNSYWEPLASDLSTACDSILVSSTSLAPRSLQLLTKVFAQDAGKAKNRIVFSTGKYLDEHVSEKPEAVRKSLETLQRHSFLTRISNHCYNAVIIDRRILWYGSLSPLGFCNEDDSIMRIESPSLAVDMQDILIGGVPVI